MSLFIQNNYGTINHIENAAVTISTGETREDSTEACRPEDITPEPAPVKSIIFTKKAQKEGKEAEIIHALKNSMQGRKDKTRAFVQELHMWQDEDYIDAHYNAQVMYDELAKLLPLPFGYDVFKRHYNSTRV